VNSRPRREKKKIIPFDNSETTFNLGGRQESGQGVRSSRKESSKQKPKEEKREKSSVKVQKPQRLTESSDPFVSQYKTIIEPILLFDKLNVFDDDKVEFEVLLKLKDIKGFKHKAEIIGHRLKH